MEGGVVPYENYSLSPDSAPNDDDVFQASTAYLPSGNPATYCAERAAFVAAPRGAA